MAYFDNAATSFPKPECVYSFMHEFYPAYGGSAGRGRHSLAEKAGNIAGETRKLLQDLLHCPAKQVVFTPTATIALNMILQGLLKDSKNQSVYISPFEHNAVTRVLTPYEQSGQVSVTELVVSEDLSYDLERIRYQFDRQPPDLVVISHASNVIGLVAPAEEICRLAKRYQAVCVVDMAQTAGLVDLNVGLESIDFAVVAGHKTLLGPTGISAFVMNPAIDLPPTLFGGTGYDSANPNMPDSLPERYEMGTLNMLGIAGLYASLQWIRQRTVTAIFLEEQARRQRLLALLDQFDFVQTVGCVPGRTYVGIVSCLFDEMSSDSAGDILNRLEIAVRTGLQCAPRAHKRLGTFPAGTVRFSVGPFTSDADFAELEKALIYIQQNL